MIGRLDLAGLLIFGLSIVWTLVAAATGGGNALPVAGVVTASAATLALSRWGTERGSALAPLAVAGVATLLALLSIRDLLRGTPGGGPLLYANGNAALYAQGAVAAAILAAGWKGWRRAGIALALALVAAVALSRSMAGTLLLALPILAALLGRRAPRQAIAISAILFVGAVAATTAVAATGPALVPEPLRAALGGPRLDLWTEGYDLMSEEPMTGVGPSRFQLESPTAQTSRGYRWAHNAWLQQGAETGVLGYALVVAMFLWAFARLWSTPRPTAVTALAAGGLGMLGLHAAVDHALHFPIIPVMAAAVVGTGQGFVGAPRDRRLTADAIVRRAIKAAVLPVGLAGIREDGDLAILAYHRVGAGSGEISLSPERFADQLAELVDSGEVISLDEAIDGERGGVVLTVDDGYRDFHEHVLPALETHRLPLTLYLATGLVARRGKRDPEALTWTQLREAISTGLVTVGSHTHAHVDLGRADEREARRELGRSKRLIEDRLDRPCRHFAYPFGIGSPAAERKVRELFDSAALAWGTNRAGRTDPFRLDRTPILRSDGRLFFRAKVRGMLDHEAAAYRVLRRGPWRRAATDRIRGSDGA